MPTDVKMVCECRSPGCTYVYIWKCVWMLFQIEVKLKIKL